jgi:hypothetical protein
MSDGTDVFKHGSTGSPVGAEAADEQRQGVTLRDYFAACAIPTLIARGMYGYTDLAMHAYAMADALLAAREVQP